MHLLIMGNVAAMDGRAGGRLSSIKSRLAQLNLTAEWRFHDSPADAREWLACAPLREFDAVVSAGGDGTLFHVVNGLWLNPARRPLGILPLGTGNAFARDLGLGPGDWQAGLKLIARGKPRLVDVGELRCGAQRWVFLNIAGLGFVVTAGRAAARLKWLGRSAYALGTLLSLARLRPLTLELDMDGRHQTRDAIFLEVSNSRYTGTRFLIAPDARIDDGLLDVTLPGRMSRLRLLRLFPSIYSGRHVEFDEVESCQVEKLEIYAPEGLSWIVDGEEIGRTPSSIRCIHRGIEVLC